ncbi:hypothetical protein EOT10_07330 [Streptomyces antnestii]|uniref:Enoyl-CoA hydratase/isomerase family protein n=1 Tax=Streptomyces antnestii TaxID=2494256 RepID=A0A437Q0M9_9ACTN|nr:hypothetical protein EOT10_07330 [Streptomyces sp. San01]
MTGTSERVTVSVSDGVADVRLNRPEKRNALDPEMFEALVTTGERLKTEPGVRAVVLSGEGPDFCSGLDFTAFRAMRTGSGSPRGPDSRRPRGRRRPPGSAPRMCGPNCPCPSSPRCAATRWGAACRSRSAPTSGSWHRTPGSACSRWRGVSSRT